MKIEEREDGTHVWLRQSWINDTLLCQERGRRAVVDPTWQMQGDSACIGTAMHAGAETYLTSLGDEAMALLAVEEAWVEMNSKPMRLTLGMTSAEMLAEAKRLWRMWLRDIYPDVAKSWQKAEEHFDVEWYTLKLGDELQRTVHIHLTGTIDLVCKDELWDWKTSGRKYSQKEKQAEAIQPTVYAIAAVRSGWLEYPVRFNYGVMMRGKDETQTVPIRRTHNHEVWLSKIVEPLVRQALVLGMSESWPLNDTHNLCSERWCAWWGGCKGHALSLSDLEPSSNS